MAGKMVHFELPSEDTGRAKDFWSGVFGWEFSNPDVVDIEYWMTRTGEDQGGAIYPGEGGLKLYFDTDDIDATLAKVGELGGKAGEKMPIPHVGWFASCTDTEGNDFSLFQSDESVTG
jgi:predicted enzyme related to lactoylglutathione lyase